MEAIVISRKGLDSAWRDDRRKTVVILALEERGEEWVMEIVATRSLFISASFVCKPLG